MSKLTYDALAIEGLQEVLEQISKTCTTLEIDFFIIGAIARNIWYVSNGENPKGTKDIDFAIYVPSEKKYSELKNILIYQYKYVMSSENNFCLISPNNKQIDLLPFGEIENEGQIILSSKGLTNTDLEGFKESYQMGLVNIQIGKQSYQTCSIPAIVILKMIAFDDRPEIRIKDIKDINSICLFYPNIEENFIWEKHNDLYDENREQDEIAMIVLGREMKKIISKNLQLEKRILNIIDGALKQESAFLVHMIEDVEKETLEMKIAILTFIKQGFAAKKTNSK